MKPIDVGKKRRPFIAYRNKFGIPQIEADSWLSCLYGLGYVHAIDRPTQILFARAVARGTAAERIADKEDLFDTDQYFRRAGLYLGLKEEVSRLDDKTFSEITAYCEGLNDALQEAGRTLPMWATGFDPQPWTQESVLLIGNLLSFGGLAVGQQQSERLLLELVQLGIHKDRLQELFAPHLDHVDFNLLHKIKMAHRLSDDALELIADLPRLAGSNAWAVSPNRSQTGAPLLAGDPHLEVNRLPAIWYEAVLKWNQNYVMGATLPGCPLFGVGRTRNLSWSVTYLKGDTSDYFIEDCRPGGESGWQYRRENNWIDFSRRIETIHRKDNQSLEMPIYFNDVGTLECNPEATGPGLYLSLAWAGSKEGSGQSIASWLRLLDCTDVRQAMFAVRETPQPTLNWIFADREGHIGRQASGWIPRRRSGQSGLVPTPAWRRENHWRGWIPADQLPSSYNPAEVFVLSANENVNQPDGPIINTLFLPDYRYRRIRERLTELSRATIDDFKALQYDVVSLQARDLLKIFLPHLPTGEIKTRLENWSCHYSPESHEASLFQRLYRNVILEIFGQPSNGQGGIGWRRMFYLASRIGYSTMVITAIDALLHKTSSTWWHSRDKGSMIRAACESIRDKDDRPWSDINAFRFTNRFFEGHRAGRLFGFHSGEFAMPGNHATPFQGHLLRAAKRESTFAPSYHIITDMSTDEAWTNLPGGPCESRFSKYYKTDIARWSRGEYKLLSPTAAE